MFGQNVDLPPKPPEEETSKQNESDLSKTPAEQSENVFPKYDVPISSSTDKESVYYFKTVENKLAQLDSTITAEQIISLTKFNISRNKTDAKLLDSLANKTYKQNEKK